ncbi:MAG: DUF362 domain-containing protein [Bacteroidales bacterium]|nr:DUF362 domain-containing protein [Bacteroidales bacterium]MDZ4203267.1 DUF362 domain-containing protein [Bacteroidales bacterium]
MKRREFITKTITAGLAAGTALKLGGFSTLWAAEPAGSAKPYDLVAVRNGEPEVMFDRAIESLGGMSKYVKRGQTVVVKPNIGWDVSVERAGNTNPGLVKSIVEHCFKAGAKDVYVFDNTCDLWTNCYSNSGIEAAAKSAGAKVVTGNSERKYRDVQIPGAETLKTVKVHELILDSDVFINVPVLKHHSSARVTVAMKNLMGIVWDRRYWHQNNLQKCIAEFAALRKPDLNVVDAYRVMTRNGPRGVSEADVSLMKQLLVSPDIVAIDAASTKIFGSEPGDIPYIVMAHEMGIGTMNLQTLSINRITL